MDLCIPCETNPWPCCWAMLCCWSYSGAYNNVAITDGYIGISDFGFGWGEHLPRLEWTEQNNCQYGRCVLIIHVLSSPVIKNIQQANK